MIFLARGDFLTKSVHHFVFPYLDHSVREVKNNKTLKKVSYVSVEIFDSLHRNIEIYIYVPEEINYAFLYVCFMIYAFLLEKIRKSLLIPRKKVQIICSFLFFNSHDGLITRNVLNTKVESGSTCLFKRKNFFLSLVTH